MDGLFDLWVINHRFCNKLSKYFGLLDTEDGGFTISLNVTKY